VINAGGVILDVLRGGQFRQGSEIGFRAEFGHLEVEDMEVFAVDEGAIAGLAAAVDGGVAAFLMNAGTVVW
jgi:hypothetical protein